MIWKREMFWRRMKKRAPKIGIILLIVVILLIGGWYKFKRSHSKRQQNLISKPIVKIKALKIDSSIFWKKKYRKASRQRDSLQILLLKAKSHIIVAVPLMKKKHHKVVSQKDMLLYLLDKRSHSISVVPLVKKKNHHKAVYKKHCPRCPCNCRSFKTKTPYWGFIFLSHFSTSHQYRFGIAFSFQIFQPKTLTEIV
jgi:hypothetical protein